MGSQGESQSQRQIQEYSNPVLLEQASDGWCVHYISVNLVRNKWARMGVTGSQGGQPNSDSGWGWGSARPPLGERILSA